MILLVNKEYIKTIGLNLRYLFNGYFNMKKLNFSHLEGWLDSLLFYLVSFVTS